MPRTEIRAGAEKTGGRPEAEKTGGRPRIGRPEAEKTGGRPRIEVRAEDRRIKKFANANGTTHPACTRVHSLRLRFALAPRD